MDRIGKARLVLIGEASHGTHDFYYERAEITKRLIAEKGFTTVTVEADWPDAYRVNCFVRGVSEDQSGERALQFPPFSHLDAAQYRCAAVSQVAAGIQQFAARRRHSNRLLRAGFLQSVRLYRRDRYLP